MPTSPPRPGLVPSTVACAWKPPIRSNTRRSKTVAAFGFLHLILEVFPRGVVSGQGFDSGMGRAAND
eukprot:60742-Prymnesium_polylepis.1